MEQSNAHILMKLNLKYRILFGLLLILLLFCFSNFKLTKEKVLVIFNEQQNTESIINIPDTKFQLSFIHSVHHTPVYETYEITQDNKLVLKETKFYSLGVGMPYSDEGGTLINNDGEFILQFSRQFDNLYLRVSPIPQHAIEISNQKYSLLEFAAPEERINIYASDKWILKKRY